MITMMMIRKTNQVPGDAFNLGDETGDAQGALNAGEEFDTEKTRREEEEKRAKTERRKAAAARQATKAQIIAAAASFGERIKERKKAAHSITTISVRLRALLMVICTAGFPNRRANRPPLACGCLPTEGDPDSWPVVLGRTLFEIFGGKQPAIRHFYLSAEHDQIPDDIVSAGQLATGACRPASPRLCHRPNGSASRVTSGRSPNSPTA